MGWVWKNEKVYKESMSGGEFSSERNDDGCIKQKVVSSQCKTEEVEPGRFIRKCEKIEEILRNCAGKPVEVVQSNREYTEEDVTDQMLKGSLSSRSSEYGPFDFPGLQNDIDAMGRGILGSIDRFFQAADEMKNGFFSVFDGSYIHDQESSSSRARQGIPIEGWKEPSSRPDEREFGNVDISGLAKDV